MKFKWGNGPVKKAEVDNDWAWWGLFVAVVIMEILVVLKMSGKI